MSGRNLVVFCDGTNNQFGEDNTNVVRLHFAAVKNSPEQVTVYDPGVGTFSSKAALTAVGRWVTRQLGSAFGYGISDNIADAYAFLMEHYREGDRIFLFGFSRGAFTARAVAGLMRVCGLLYPQSRNLVAYAIELYQKESVKAIKAAQKYERKERKRLARLDLSTCARFREQFGRRVPVHFLGLWDTVTSVGSVRNPLRVANTTWNPDVRIVRHAIAIDERRKFFRQNLWRPAAGQDVRQVWFAGAHADVGGGYPEAESGLAKIALAWMLEQARAAGLLIDAGALPQVLPAPGGAPVPAPPDPLATMHDELSRVGWKIAQLVPRRIWMRDRKAGTWKRRLSFRVSALPRFIEDGSWIHRSVLERIGSGGSYEPRNVPRDARDETGNRIDWPAAIGREWPGRRDR